MTARRATGVLLAVGAVAVAAVYYMFDPATSRFAPKCFFRLFTGFDCPGCGSQRMLHALLHGDIAGAWNANAYLLCMGPVILLMLWASGRRIKCPKVYAAVNSLPMIITISVSLLAWTIYRNL